MDRGMARSTKKTMRDPCGNHAGTMRGPYTYLYTTQARTDAQSARAHTCDLQHSLNRLRLGILPQTLMHKRSPHAINSTTQLKQSHRTILILIAQYNRNTTKIQRGFVANTMELQRVYEGTTKEIQR